MATTTSPPEKPIPPRQAQALSAIRAHWAAFSEAPARSEIGRALGITAVSAHLLVQKLAARGLVTVAPKVWRGVEVS